MKPSSILWWVRAVARPGVLALVLAAGSVHAQDLSALASGASADLERALADLAETRKSVEAERVPLSRELAAMEQRLVDRRAELGKAQRFQENQLVELNALKTEAKRRGDEVKYVDSLLSEYAKAFQSRLHFVEEPRFAKLFAELEKAGAPELGWVPRWDLRVSALTTAIGRVEGALGGERFEAKALDKRGLLHAGHVALVGPFAVFASGSGEVAGPLQQELNKADPSVVEVDRAIADASRQLASTGTGNVALDPTLGNAFKLAALKESLVEKLEKGGWAMIPLLGIGFAAAVIALLKWIQLSRFRLAKESDLQKVLGHLEQGQRDQALSHARSISGPAGELLSTAIQHVDEKKEYIEEILYERMLAARTKLERGLPFLALTATTGPLLGLLGTVMGMIATFKLISSFGSGDPKVLAAGISEALIATATGMTVAIPALLLHAFLARMAKGIIGSMEQTAVGFINGVPEVEKAPFS
ncbi:MAG: MotA/TolQ/ExbB proton channel family protein [Verrucomicrobiales bacterium]|nr:MotA/TolQ/ExbB proton channel family protein [Verrucomicrobiales bacterium]